MLGGRFRWRDGMGDEALVENVKAVLERGRGRLTRSMIACLEGLQRFVEGEVGVKGEVRLWVPILGTVRARRDSETGEVVVEGRGVGVEESEGVVDWDFDALADEDWDAQDHAI